MEIEVADVYARALFDAAVDVDAVEEIKEDLEELDQILKDNPVFSRLMSNPAVSITKKKEMLSNVFEGKVHRYVFSFLCILVEKKRISHFHRIVKRYYRIYDDKLGERVGTVWTPSPASKEQISYLEQATSKLLRKKVILRNKVDKNLIGGMQIFIDGKLIDTSYKTRLEEMTKLIRR